jgi:hypothetical protein
MKAYTIWLTGRIPENYAACLKSQSDIVREMIDEIRARQILEMANERYHGVNSIAQFMENPYAAADYVRMYLMSIEPHTLYLDCDVEIVAQLPALGDAAAMEYHENTAMYNPGLVWNGNRIDLFDEFCEYWFTQSQVRILYSAAGKLASDHDFMKLLGFYRHYMYTVYKGESHGHNLAG